MSSSARSTRGNNQISLSTHKATHLAFRVPTLLFAPAQSLFSCFRGCVIFTFQNSKSDSKGKLKTAPKKVEEEKQFLTSSITDGRGADFRHLTLTSKVNRLKFVMAHGGGGVDACAVAPLRLASCAGRFLSIQSASLEKSPASSPALLHSYAPAKKLPLGGGSGQQDLTSLSWCVDGSCLAAVSKGDNSCGKVSYFLRHCVLYIVFNCQALPNWSSLTARAACSPPPRSP